MGNLFNEQESAKNPISKKYDVSCFIFHDSDIKSSKVYEIEKIRPHEQTRINSIIQNFHKNGKPRKSEDFSINNFTKFYPKEDSFFHLEETNLIHNRLIIYNEDESEINKIYIYKGDLNMNEERHGFGKLITQYYELIGMWKNNKLNGWGRQSRCNGEVFEGRFEDGLLNGKGIFLDAHSNKYVGEFKEMKIWGKGKLITDKIIYEGDFNTVKIFF